jgi:hypothetical protein
LGLSVTRSNRLQAAHHHSTGHCDCVCSGSGIPNRDAQAEIRVSVVTNADVARGSVSKLNAQAAPWSTRSGAEFNLDSGFLFRGHRLRRQADA